MHESVKHLLLTLPRQMAQLGGGEPAPSRCWLSLLLLSDADWLPDVDGAALPPALLPQ